MKASEIETRLRSLGSELPAERGETLFRTGDAVHSVYFVRSGAVRLLRHGPRGEEVVLHDARAGEFFAEAALGSRSYHCDAVVTADAVLLKIHADTLRSRLDTDSLLAHAWSMMLARQLRLARSRVERLSLRSAADRVRHLLLSEGEGARCELAYGSLMDLARRVGITHESLYRTLAQLARAGEIERGPGYLRLK